MPCRILAWIAAAVALSAWNEASAQEPTPTPWAVSGFVEQDLRAAFPDDDYPFVERNRSVLGLRFEAVPASGLRAVADGRFVWLGETRADSPEGLADRERLDPFRVEGDALFVEVSRVFGTPVSIRAGRQAIRWGSGLLLNPTSTVSPPDLEDPLRFGRPMGTEMLLAFANAGPIRIEGLVVPRFRPAFLPAVDDRDALRASGNPTAEAIADDPEWSIDLQTRSSNPGPAGENVQGAARLSGTVPVLRVDAAISWYAGRTPLPQVGRADLDLDFGARTLDGEAELRYPRIQVWGMDLAGEIPLGPLGGAGAWVEAAWVVPVPMRRTLVANGTAMETTEFEDPYLRAVAGVDHVTSGGTYLATQWARGFLDEFGAEAQRDYAFLIVERGLLRDRVKVRGVAGWDFGGQSVLLAPEVVWTAGGAVALSAAGYVGIGDSDSKFGGPLAGPPVAIARATLRF